MPCEAQQTSDATALVRAYPDFLAGVEGNALVWKDGARMPIDDGAGAKPFARLLAAPDIKDMFVMPYPVGETGIPPAADFDPGRVRHAALFEKMYGNCRQADIKKSFVAVPWLPGKGGRAVMFSSVNGAADQLRKVSEELARLPDTLRRYLVPSAGTFNCRPIAGTKRPSAHGYGIAIDISTRHAHYWQWSKPGANGGYAYRNAIPWEIINVFEKHGFIWGGKWYHYDTMHFEYRPELLPAASR